jgi:hydrogenase nickel incorporation protein HypA/HybF
MHELSIAQALIDQVGGVAKAQGARRVVTIRVVVGALSGVDPESLRMVFPLAAEDTPLAGAVLEVECVTASVRCTACGGVSTPEAPFVYCATCGSRDVQIEAGRELFIRSADIETEADPPAKLE